jgi:hypothetical protein
MCPLQVEANWQSRWPLPQLEMLFSTPLASGFAKRRSPYNESKTRTDRQPDKQGFRRFRMFRPLSRTKRLRITRRKFSTVATGAVVVFGFVCCVLLQVAAQGNEGQKNERDDAAAAAAFETIIPVLHHPRCMNCHSAGDFPRQGDDSHRHTMLVRRGPAGDGTLVVKCSTCHQDHNWEGLHMPPGAPGWHLPSPAALMIWQGLNDHQLCELFKNPNQNGNRSVGQIVEHMSTPLVLWGWNPGDGRTPVPMPEAQFLAKVKEWAAKGAACPADGSASPTNGR